MVDTTFRGGLPAGEEILWTGRPAQGLLFVPEDRTRPVLTLVNLGPGLAFLLWIGKGLLLLQLIALLLAAMMLYYLAGRFFVDAWLRKSLYYAVTSHRVLIARTGPFSQYTAFDLAALPPLHLFELAGGRGTIRFGEPSSKRWVAVRSSWRAFDDATPALNPIPQFLAIDDARQVLKLIETGRADLLNKHPLESEHIS